MKDENRTKQKPAILLFQMARTKQTAKNSGGQLKAPRKQLKSKKSKQKKTAEQLELVKTKLKQLRKDTVLYEVALKHYGDDGYELPLPPPVKKPNGEGNMGRPELEKMQCGMCYKVFLSMLGWSNHMPYHHRGGGHKCGFCLEAMKTDQTIKLVDCWFATKEAAIKHLLRKHEIKIGVLKTGKELVGSFKKRNMSKIENTKQLQEKLAKAYIWAYELPEGLTFNELQMKITGDKKYDHPLDYDDVRTIPENAVEPADVEKYVIPWKGESNAESEVKPGSPEFFAFDASGGCFDFFDLHKARGGTYHSKYLKLLIRAKDYEFGFSRAAYAKCEVKKIEGEIPEGCDRKKVKKYKVEWLGYEERTVENVENLDKCEKVIEEFWKYKELEEKLNEQKTKQNNRKSTRKSRKNTENNTEIEEERVLRKTKEVNYRKN